MYFCGRQSKNIRAGCLNHPLKESMIRVMCSVQPLWPSSTVTNRIFIFQTVYLQIHMFFCCCLWRCLNRLELTEHSHISRDTAPLFYCVSHRNKHTTEHNRLIKYMWWAVSQLQRQWFQGAGSVGGWRHSSNHALSSTPQPGDESWMWNCTKNKE